MTLFESQQIPLSVRLAKEEFALLAKIGQEVGLEAGRQLFAEGDLTENFYILLDGELKIMPYGNKDEAVVSCLVTEAPLLIGGPLLNSAEVLRPSRLIKIDADAYLHYVAASSPANTLLVAGLEWRLQRAESLLHQSEKLAALGQLAAGLAHELNNPAAAGKRAAEQLSETLMNLYALALRLGDKRLGPAQLQRLEELQQDAVDCDAAVKLDPLTRGDQEEAIGDWLEAHGLERAWELSANFVANGMTLTRLQSFAEMLPTEAVSDALAWLGGVMSVGAALNVIEESTARISELVGAVKAYAYMDRAPLQEVDLHQGLDNTLIILKHKLGGIEVIRDYAEDIPHILAYGGELNQVWTNLIDNAIDALKDKGRIRIRTFREGEQVGVDVIDNGPGIPREMQSRLFEPFFTTKGLGQGAGLGLTITYRIVVERHGGDIRVTSEPGHTCFRVCLPRQVPDHQGVKETPWPSAR